MMEFYTSLNEDLVRLHRQQLLQEAARDRLLRESRHLRPGLMQTLRTRLGRLLIAAGEKLQEPYTLHNSHPARAC